MTLRLSVYCIVQSSTTKFIVVPVTCGTIHCGRFQRTSSQNSETFLISKVVLNHSKKHQKFQLVNTNFLLSSPTLYDFYLDIESYFTDFK